MRHQLSGAQQALGCAGFLVRCAFLAERNRHCVGRIVAVCRVASRDLNACMVEQGWALAYRRYSTDSVSREASAEDARCFAYLAQGRR